MSYLVLARKYRPQTFEEVLGQDHVTRTLMHAISSNRVAHAVLFSGPRGTGKTTVARILAKAMNCKQGPTPIPCNVCRSCTQITSGSSVDVFEIDGASNNSVDQIRDLRDNVKYMPADGLFKIYIIDEVHMLSTAAFNALLKTLEEPPSHILFVFATTEVHKIPATILSRCQRHDFKRVGIRSIVGHLEEICAREGAVVSVENLWSIGREADGSVRDALSLLDQVMAWDEGDGTDPQIQEILGIIDRNRLFQMSDALLRGSVPQLLEVLDDVYSRGHDIRKLYSDFIEHVRNLLVVKLGKNVDRLLDLPEHEMELMREQVKGVTAFTLSQILDTLFREEPGVRFSFQPKFALEMTFIRIVQIRPALPIDDLIQKLDDLRKGIEENRKTHVVTERGDRGGGVPGGPYFAGDSECVDRRQEETRSEGAESVDSEESFQQIRQKLLDLIAEDSPALAANLTKCRIKQAGAGSLVIEVTGNGFCLNMVRRKKNLAAIENACKQVFGNKTGVTVTAADEEKESGQKRKNGVPAGRRQQEILTHPVVTEAMELFKGKIVEVKIV